MGCNCTAGFSDAELSWLAKNREGLVMMGVVFGGLIAVMLVLRRKSMEVA